MTHDVYDIRKITENRLHICYRLYFPAYTFILIPFQVILGVILALGFASGSNFQDLTLTIIAQFSTLGILLWAIYRHRRWCLAALKTIPRDIV